MEVTDLIAEQQQHEINDIETFIAEAISIVGSEHQQVRGQESNLAASQLITDQKGLFATAIDVFASVMGIGHADIRGAQNVRNAIDEAIQVVSYTRFETDEGHRVVGINVPVFPTTTRAKISDLAMRTKAGGIPAELAFDVLMAVIIRATRFKLNRDIIQSAQGYSIRLFTAMCTVEASISASRIALSGNNALLAGTEQRSDDVFARIAARAADIEAEMTKLEGWSKETRALIDADGKALATSREEAHLAARNLEERTGKLQAEVDAASLDASERYGDAEAKAQAFISALTEKGNFAAIRSDWQSRAKSANAAFILSSIVLAGFLLFIPIWAIWENAAVLDFFQRLAEAASIQIGPDAPATAIVTASLSRLVIITVPLGLYFWLIRIVVRFNMRSLLLMDDARQRATMMETYYRLIEKEAASKEERALVIQALMRPPPGHGPDTVEPPNFTDVLGKVTGGN